MVSYIRKLHVGMAVLGATIAITNTVSAQAGDNNRLQPIPNGSVVTLPSPEVTKPVSNTEQEIVTQPPVITGNPGCENGNCANGMCEPYYRDRPKGDKDRKRHIILNNRAGEPDWYKEYRCQHYGYYPTQWAAWPENWLMCRNPHPGEHPYDRRQPSEKKPIDRFDKTKKTPNSSTGKGPAIDGKSDEPTRPLRKEPEPLPDLSKEKKQADEKSLVPPARNSKQNEKKL